jgi:histone H3/H4
MSDAGPAWRHCSICRTSIGFGEPYFVCSVSTCNRKRNPLYFCSLACWEAHLPMMRHRDAWAEQVGAPTEEEWAKQQAEERPDADADADDDPAPSRRAPSFSDADIDETTGVRRISEAARDAYHEAKRRRVVTQSDGDTQQDDLPREVLIVASKLKKYIKARSGMNTSEGVLSVLSDYVRRICNEAIRNAARDGRKTVMDRDFDDLV